MFEVFERKKIIPVLGINRSCLCPKPIATKESLHNSQRSVIAQPGAVRCVVFLPNSGDISCKKTPCGPSRSAHHSPARVMQRVPRSIAARKCHFEWAQQFPIHRQCLSDHDAFVKLPERARGPPGQADAPARGLGAGVQWRWPRPLRLLPAPAGHLPHA